LTRGESIGLAFKTQAAFVSLLAVLAVIIMIIRNYWIHVRNVGMENAKLLREPADIYVLSILTADLIQSVGIAMTAKGVHEGVVKQGTYCSAQGALQQLGGTCAAMATLALAAHSVTAVWLRTNPERKGLTYSIVALIWLYVILCVSIPLGTHSDTYIVPSPYWCWIGRNHTPERYFGQYAWLWSTLGVSVVSYIPLFLWARGNIEFDTVNSLKFHWVKVSPQNQRSGSKRRAFGLLAYPLVYSVIILPLTVIRWMTFSENEANPTMPSAASFFATTLYALIGAFNVLLLLVTRPYLLLLRSRREDVGRPPSANTSMASVHAP
jgi:hypothetical protein